MKNWNVEGDVTVKSKIKLTTNELQIEIQHGMLMLDQQHQLLNKSCQHIIGKLIEFTLKIWFCLFERLLLFLLHMFRFLF